MKKIKFITAMMIAVMSLSSVFAIPYTTEAERTTRKDFDGADFGIENIVAADRFVTEQVLQENTYIISTEILDTLEAIGASQGCKTDLEYSGMEKKNRSHADINGLRTLIANNNGEPIVLPRYSGKQFKNDGYPIDKRATVLRVTFYKPQPQYPAEKHGLKMASWGIS